MVNLYSEEILFKDTFFLLKTPGKFLHFPSFEQVFLGLENLCENFNNISEIAINRDNVYYKNTLIFVLK
jgi:hypothetical protein